MQSRFNVETQGEIPEKSDKNLRIQTHKLGFQRETDLEKHEAKKDTTKRNFQLREGLIPAQSSFNDFYKKGIFGKGHSLRNRNKGMVGLFAKDLMSKILENKSGDSEKNLKMLMSLTLAPVLESVGSKPSSPEKIESPNKSQGRRYFRQDSLILPRPAEHSKKGLEKIQKDLEAKRQRELKRQAKLEEIQAAKMRVSQQKKREYLSKKELDLITPKSSEQIEIKSKIYHPDLVNFKPTLFKEEESPMEKSYCLVPRIAPKYQISPEMKKRLPKVIVYSDGDRDYCSFWLEMIGRMLERAQLDNSVKVGYYAQVGVKADLSLSVEMEDSELIPEEFGAFFSKLSQDIELDHDMLEDANDHSFSRYLIQ